MSSPSTPTVDFWDLDHTLFASRKLLRPMYLQLAEKLGKPLESIQESYTLEKLFAALDLPASEIPAYEEENLKILATDDLPYLIADALEVLKERSRIARQVVITAGRPEWQKAKFEAMHSLHPFFAEEDRHFVDLETSKAPIMTRYIGTKTFIDDSPAHLRAAINHHVDVTCIRPMWPSEHRAADPGDGKLWKVATNADELRAALAAVTM